MLSSASLVAILLALAMLGLSFVFPQNRRVNFLSATLVVFLVYVMPKIGYLVLDDSSVLLPSAAALAPAAVNAAATLIAAFVAMIALGYVAAAVFAPDSGPTAPAASRYDPAALRATSAAAVMPAFLISFVLFVIAAGVTPQDLFSKREMIVDGAITPAYVLQKAALVAKCGFYLMMIRVVSAAPGRGDFAWFGAFFLATALVHLVSGQRSGILLLVVEALLALQVAGRLKLRYLVAFGSFFLVLCVVIVWSRLRDYGDLALVNVVFRRYFFDVEKIAGLVEYAVSHPVWRFEPMAIFLTVSDGAMPTYSLHHYIGERVFGTAYGVPPSLLGEIVLYAGPIFVVPVTFAIAFGVASLERLSRRVPEPVMRVAIVSVLAKVYYFALNSDVASLVRRSLFDLVLLLAALAIYWVFRDVLRAQLGRA